ncbi:hypothetical protein BJX68DRAFT_262208 [Aspergillus pseudodeflectus]|uniref:CCZ1/INTU/HSP4 first Longin domain-containing protein n=1 Tax=Aspergillus pseudodeflectus TaxID=176178 RepID=A0ABR4L299_9EURO
MPEGDSSSVIPAQLSFLAIYNPQLGTTDETIREQVVFYTSRPDLSRRQDSLTATNEGQEDNGIWNERLRQIGLAQGMVSFARNFSEGKAVDYIETERSQIVLHELERDWWILASVDLTRLPVGSNNGSSSQKESKEPVFNYSSRELTPPQLLIQQLRRAHSIFLLHHSPSLDALYKSAGRSTLCTFLENFWLKFAWNWDVLLFGNPAVEIYNGVKLSAGGELGVGVGEEEWGSGEREVLEDFVSRTDGLVDLVVSRFGDPYESTHDSQTTSEPEGAAEDRWLGSDAYPRPSDGVVFSGVGAIERQSLVSISQWVEWIYRYGPDAYGVGEDPTSPRRWKRRARQRGRTTKKTNKEPSAPSDTSQSAVPDRPFSPGIPRPLVTGTPSPPPPPDGPERKSKEHTNDESYQGLGDKASEWMATGTETFVKYLTLGYGSSWGFSSGSSSPRPQVEPPKGGDGSNDIGSEAPMANNQPRYRNRGRYIIGLQDNMTSPDIILEETDPTDSARSNEKIAKRTIHVHLATLQQESTASVQLQIVVYVHRPFIYTFLFDTSTPGLLDPSLYHRIHHQLGPLQKPLSISTSPSTAASRISHTPESIPKPQQQNQPIYDLVYEPHNLTIRSSIPNIPDLISQIQPQRSQVQDPSALSRVEAISIHHRLLTTYIETRSRPLELERTCKTSRGWWIVWVRVSYPPSQANPDLESNLKQKHQEAFIIRQASDHAASSALGHARNTSSIGGGSGARFFRDLGGASSPGSLQSLRMDTGPGKLVEGLGLDARRYIESLLSLNR